MATKKQPAAKKEVAAPEVQPQKASAGTLKQFNELSETFKSDIQKVQEAGTPVTDWVNKYISDVRALIQQ